MNDPIIDAYRAALEQNPELAHRLIAILQEAVDAFNNLPPDVQFHIVAIADARWRAS